MSKPCEELMSCSGKKGNHFKRTVVFIVCFIHKKLHRNTDSQLKPSISSLTYYCYIGLNVEMLPSSVWQEQWLTGLVQFNISHVEKIVKQYRPRDVDILNSLQTPIKCTIWMKIHECDPFSCIIRHKHKNWNCLSMKNFNKYTLNV